MGFFVGDWGIILSGINYDEAQSKRIINYDEVQSTKIILLCFSALKSLPAFGCKDFSLCFLIEVSYRFRVLHLGRSMTHC